ncbi:MAG: hypothetical protein QOI74_2503 [Micromonosporaceae bacterium]|jgi:hypothetical protein|nr:hypothetical protein [Micromonosporaceae bacterium]MDT5036309.1 hypothetical protein [Micromonosporaceae bacterium]
MSHSPFTFGPHARCCADLILMGAELSDVSADRGHDRPPTASVAGDLFRAPATVEVAEPERPAVDDSQAAMERLRMPFDVDQSGQPAD